MDRWKLVVCLAVLATFVGCSGGGGEKLGTAKASGTVTFDGKAVEGANVTFSPQDKGGRAAYGLTDSQGRFKLNTTATVEGAMPGAYSVAVIKQKTEGAMSAEEAKAHYEKTGQPPPPAKVTNELPEKYQDAKVSGLTFTVKAGDANEFKIELKK